MNTSDSEWVAKQDETARLHSIPVPPSSVSQLAVILGISRDEWRARAEQAEAKIATLEARLAEVAPVVEAAERAALSAHVLYGSWCKAQGDLDDAVRALRAARAKREGGS